MKRFRKALIFIIILTFIPFCALSRDSARSKWDLAIALYYNFLSGQPDRLISAQNAEILNVMNYLYIAMPEKAALAAYSDKNNQRYFSLEMTESDNIPAARKKAKKITDEIVKEYMPFREKIKTIYDYLIMNCEYYLVDDDDSIYTTTGALLNGKAVCDGYASAMMLMCQTVGIPCYRISSAEIRHAWNIVYDGSNWLMLDATWEDSEYITSKFEIGYVYFLKTASEFKKNGHIFDENTTQTLSYIQQLNFCKYYLLDADIEKIVSSFEMSAPSVVNLDTRMYAAAALNVLGIFNGTDRGFELDRHPTRNEMAAMITRVLGKEAESSARRSPFSDTSWADGYVGCLYDIGLIKGKSQNIYGGEDCVSLRDYAVMMLRVLGYIENEHFNWESSAAFADSLKIIPAEAWSEAELTRGSLAVITFNALFARLNGDNRCLIEKLAEDGAIDTEAAAKLTEIINSTKMVAYK